MPQEPGMLEERRGLVGVKADDKRGGLNGFEDGGILRVRGKFCIILENVSLIAG